MVCISTSFIRNFTYTGVGIKSQEAVVSAKSIGTGVAHVALEVDYINHQRRIVGVYLHLTTTEAPVLIRVRFSIKFLEDFLKSLRFLLCERNKV